MDDFNEVSDWIEQRFDVISRRRSEEQSPPEASFHLLLDGKEYLVLVQPTDLGELDDQG